MKKRVLIITVIILLVLLATFGASVALFSKALNGEKTTSVKVGDLTFKYTEITGIGNGININDAEPISDQAGKVLDQYFDFKIDANLVGSDLIYEVNIEPTADTTINLDGVKVYITTVENNVEKDIQSNYDGLGKVKTISDYTNRIIYQERVLKNTKNYEKNFRVRMWIDEDVDIYTNEYMGTRGAFRINVNARSNQSMVDSTIPVPTITGGTGTTWTTKSQTISLVPTTPAIGGVTYEYYVTDDSTDVPNDLTIATGTTDDLYNVIRIGQNYIYYRTVSANNKSAWSEPQIVYYDNTEYTITYNLNGGSATNPSTYKVDTPSFTLNNPTRTGYTFSGWTGSNGSTAKTSVTVQTQDRENKAYTANWEAINYSITYNLNSGTNPSGAITSYTIETNTFSLPTPTRTGYTFGGWYTASNFSGSQVTQIAKGTTGNKTYYANWTANTYTVNFYSNPYQIYSTSLVVTLNGRTFTKKNSGNALVAYSYGGKYVGPILVGNVADSVAYTTYDSSTGTVNHTALGNITVGGQVYYYSSDQYWFGSDLTSTGGVATKKYTYSQYATSTIQQQQKATNDLLNDSKANLKTQSFTYGTAQNLTSNTFTRTGYTFQGWATCPTCNVAYSNSQSVSNLTATNNGTVDLYAIWKEVDYTTSNLAVGDAVTYYDLGNEGTISDWTVIQTGTEPLLVATVGSPKKICLSCG